MDIQGKASIWDHDAELPASNTPPVVNRAENFPLSAGVSTSTKYNIENPLTKRHLKIYGYTGKELVVFMSI